MSTQYEAVKTHIYEEVSSINKQLHMIQEDCIRQINGIAVSEELSERKEDLIEKLSSGALFSIEEPESASVVIGTARAGHFSWRSENGFRDLYSFERWLEAHPEFHIVDEYGTAISLNEFKSVVDCFGTGISKAKILADTDSLLGEFAADYMRIQSHQ